MLLLGILQASLGQAQTHDTLALRVIPLERIVDSAVPASHRSAKAKVDQPVRVLYCPPVFYPPSLAYYGFAGHVVVRFVVDTLGLAELEDLVVVEASNIGFLEPVRRAMRKCRYRPAKKSGRPVRSLVQQRIRFEDPNREPSR